MAAITITNAGLNMLRDAMSGASNPLITYVALGTSSTPASAGDTRLGAETFRKRVTSYANGVNPGEIIINMYLSDTDAVGTGIQEVGFFGGNAATSNPNTGVLLARGPYTHTKTDSESITLQLDFQL
jgi:hypothetical protein